MVTLLGPDGGEVVGCGVYLGRGRVLTCSHVVNEAIGRDWFHQEAPQDVPVPVGFPVARSSGPLASRCVGWIPARRTGWGAVPSRPARVGDPTWFGDLAVLELADDTPEPVRAAEWAKMTQGQDVRAWYGGGQPFTYADGCVESCDEKLGFVDSRMRGAAIGPGYSGGPLWCDEEGAAVGIVLGVMEPPPGAFAAGQVIRRTLVLPWQAINAELSTLADAEGRAFGFPPAASRRDDERSPSEDPATRHSLTALVAGLLADPAVRAEQGRRLADELGLGSVRAVPSVDDIVDILLTRHRAVATFVEGLPAGGRKDSQRLLALGRATLVAGLLSVREHAWLMDLLSDDLRDRLTEAAREALPHTTLFDAPLPSAERAEEPSGCGTVQASDPHRLISELEGFWGDSAPVPEGSPRVPALLRAVEYLAATCTPKRMRDLWKWSEQVAHRLGVAPEALNERRNDAAEWARHRRERARAASPRLTVQLTRCPGETFRCAAWYAPGTGVEDTERQVVADDRPRTAADIVRLLHRVLVRETATAEPASAVPLVEVLLDLDELDVAVDEWENEASPYEVPLVLGAEYPVVVRCPEARRRAPEALRHWRSRWAEIDRGAMLRIDHRHTTPRQVYGLLKADLAVSRVILDCPAQHRAELRAVCLVLGVPVVVWDRKAPPGTPGDRLTALLLNGPIRSLPQRVRRHRARVLAESDASPSTVLAPALVWDDASRPPPHAVWMDPTVEEPAP
ncbi:trypsin-like peptidase domain-containing protein [Streptomyces sp. H51]|uniref:VMAP-C domain-containing protein n=1 Tax=Streptomyces sp. H51 TaxID=3111770 RepID=UPI002D78489C|nr:trypsin-like peptidase domain-containing protein [Streptomyces sp. H51]